MKNMKLYKKALLILSLGLTLNSCLDLDPQDQPGRWQLDGGRR